MRDPINDWYAPGDYVIKETNNNKESSNMNIKLTGEFATKIANDNSKENFDSIVRAVHDVIAIRVEERRNEQVRKQDEALRELYTTQAFKDLVRQDEKYDDIFENVYDNASLFMKMFNGDKLNRKMREQRIEIKKYASKLAEEKLNLVWDKHWYTYHEPSTLIRYAIDQAKNTVKTDYYIARPTVEGVIRTMEWEEMDFNELVNEVEETLLNGFKG